MVKDKMSKQRYRILEYIYDNQTAVNGKNICTSSQKEIADALGVSIQGVGLNIMILDLQEYIEADKRKYAVTEKGMAFINKRNSNKSNQIVPDKIPQVEIKEPLLIKDFIKLLHLNIGSKTLFALLRNEGLLSQYNVPDASYLLMGFFTYDGKSPKVTQRGAYCIKNILYKIDEKNTGKVA